MSRLSTSLLVIVLGAALLVACGGGDDAPTATTLDQAGATPGAGAADAQPETGADGGVEATTPPDPNAPAVAADGGATAAPAQEEGGPDRLRAFQNLVHGDQPVSQDVANCVVAEVTDEQLAEVDNYSNEWRASVAAADEPSALAAEAMAIVQNCSGGVEATDG